MRLRRSSACIACWLLLVSLCLPSAWAGGRPPLVYGISAKPFPAIADLDYPFSRAEAWLASLLRASRLLPDPSLLRLHLPGPDPALARLAICALIAPVDVVTPRIAPGNEIRVFRKWPSDPAKAIEALNGRFFIIELEMAIIWETGRAISDLRRIWPDSVAAAAMDSQRLGKLRSLLDDLWQAAELNAEALTGHPASFCASFNEATDSAAALLGMAREDPEHMPGPLARALDMFMRRETREPDTRELWQRLAGNALYLRALGHRQADQAGLANADFGAALARLRNSDPDLVAEIHIARGDLARESGNDRAMCADYAAACGLGRCASLAGARRMGRCLGTAE